MQTTDQVVVEVNYDDDYPWKVLNDFHPCPVDPFIYEWELEVRYNAWRCFAFDGKYWHVDFIASDSSRILVKRVSPSYWGFDRFIATPVPMEFVESASYDKPSALLPAFTDSSVQY